MQKSGTGISGARECWGGGGLEHVNVGGRGSGSVNVWEWRGQDL